MDISLPPLTDSHYRRSNGMILFIDTDWSRCTTDISPVLPPLYRGYASYVYCHEQRPIHFSLITVCAEQDRPSNESNARSLIELPAQSTYSRRFEIKILCSAFPTSVRGNCRPDKAPSARQLFPGWRSFRKRKALRGPPLAPSNKLYTRVPGLHLRWLSGLRLPLRA